MNVITERPRELPDLPEGKAGWLMVGLGVVAVAVGWLIFGSNDEPGELLIEDDDLAELFD